MSDKPNFGFNMMANATADQKFDAAFDAAQALFDATRALNFFNADGDFDSEMQMMADAMAALKKKAKSFQ